MLNKQKSQPPPHTHTDDTSGEHLGIKWDLDHISVQAATVRITFADTNYCPSFLDVCMPFSTPVFKCG